MKNKVGEACWDQIFEYTGFQTKEYEQRRFMGFWAGWRERSKEREKEVMEGTEILEYKAAICYDLTEVWEKSIPGRETSKCENLEAEACPACLWKQGGQCSWSCKRRRKCGKMRSEK